MQMPMRRVFHSALTLLLIGASLLGSGGCSGSKDSQPNPELKVPDIPPSTRDTKKLPKKK